MPKRIWLVLSIGLYAAACMLPALADRRPPAESPADPTYGWYCLVLGVTYGLIIVWPFLIWLVNPLLWAFWYRSLLRRPTRLFTRAWIVIHGILGLTVICIALNVKPLMGAVLWVASMVAGAFAVETKTPEVVQNEA